MPAEPVYLVIALAVAANLVLMAFVIVPPMLGRRGPFTTPEALSDDENRVDAIRRAAAATPAGESVAVDGVPARAYDRVVRIASWVFILATTVIVTVTGLWPDTAQAILILLATAGLFVLVVHDVLPARALGGAKFVVEGSVAVTFATLLILLTGQEKSPFFFTYPIIVAGAALVVSPRVTLALAGAASTGYLAAVLAPLEDRLLDPRGAATVGINLAALVLLAYVTMVIGREQRRSREAAIVASTVDPLTGLFNRTFFFSALEREIARSSRSGRGFCLVMADLDGLKDVNDRHGHFYGDRVLRTVGEVIRAGVRRIDTAARYGGDEFVVLLPETDPTGAWVLAEKIRLGVSDQTVPGPGFEVRTSLSLGIVSYPSDGQTADTLMISADGAMYASKRAGRDRISGPPPTEPVAAAGEATERV